MAFWHSHWEKELIKEQKIKEAKEKAESQARFDDWIRECLIKCQRGEKMPMTKGVSHGLNGTVLN